MREHKRKEHGAQTCSAAQSFDEVHVRADVDENSLKEELDMCKHFMVDSEIEKKRHSFHNFAWKLWT